MEDYDVLVAPAAQVVPFDAEIDYPPMSMGSRCRTTSGGCARARG